MSDEKQPYRPMRTFSLCIDDVPAEAYVKSPKNGKTYINFTNEEKEADQWGNDQTYYIQQTAEERANKTPKIFCGRGKTLGKKNSYNNSNQASNQAPTPTGSVPQNNNFEKDLPF